MTDERTFDLADGLTVGGPAGAPTIAVGVGPVTAAPAPSPPPAGAPPGPTDQGPLTPEAVREEVRRVMSDPNHTHHKGWHQGWPSAKEYVDKLYARIAGGDAKLALGAGPIRETVGPPPELQAAYDTALQERYDDAGRAGIRAVASELFGGLEETLHTIDDAFLGLPPAAATEGRLVVAETMHDLHKVRQGPRTAGQFDPAAIGARFTEAVQREFGPATEAMMATAGAMEAHLLPGVDLDELARRAFDGLAPEAAAEFLVRHVKRCSSLQRLYQSRT